MIEGTFSGFRWSFTGLRDVDEQGGSKRHEKCNDDIMNELGCEYARLQCIQVVVVYTFFPEADKNGGGCPDFSTDVASGVPGWTTTVVEVGHQREWCVEQHEVHCRVYHHLTIPIQSMFFLHVGWMVSLGKSQLEDGLMKVCAIGE